MRLGKLLVLGFIAAVGVVIVAVMWRGDCLGGATVADEAACRAAGMPAALCREAFARADAVARSEGPIHHDRGRCEERYRTCLEATHAIGWVPKPAAFCIVATADGKLGRMTSVYRAGG